MPYTVISAASAQAATAITLGAPLTSVGETLESMQETLNSMLGDRDDTDATRTARWINKAYQHLTASVNLTELEGSVTVPTVADQPFYNLAKQIAWIKRLSISDDDNYPIEEGRQLLKIDLAKYRQLSVIDADTPKYWFRLGRILVLYATPDDAYNLAMDVKIRPDDLENSTDSPLLPIEWHEPLVLRARYVALSELRMLREASVALNEYVTCVRPLLNTDAEERESEEAHMSPARSVRQLYRGR